MRGNGKQALCVTSGDATTTAFYTHRDGSSNPGFLRLRSSLELTLLSDHLLQLKSSTFPSLVPIQAQFP